MHIQTSEILFFIFGFCLALWFGCVNGSGHSTTICLCFIGLIRIMYSVCMADFDFNQFYGFNLVTLIKNRLCGTSQMLRWMVSPLHTDTPNCEFFCSASVSGGDVRREIIDHCNNCSISIRLFFAIDADIQKRN